MSLEQGDLSSLDANSSLHGYGARLEKSEKPVTRSPALSVSTQCHDVCHGPLQGYGTAGCNQTQLERETMSKDRLANEIQDVRERLREIEEERSRLPDEAVGDRGALNAEEHQLRARLIRLQDATIKPWDTAELPGVPGRLISSQ